MNLVINKESKIHFIGIGGSGMTPLAELCYQRGATVTGSDQNLSDNIKKLQSFGIQVATHHDITNISGDTNYVVYSSAIPSENHELKFARQKGLQTLHRSDLLAYFINTQDGIAVSGTHGKTTTTALVVHILSSLGISFESVVGGQTEKPIGETKRTSPTKSFIVAEADESDGSFLKYKPFINIINNIDLDHLDYYRDEAHIQESFDLYSQQTSPRGALVAGCDNLRCRSIYEKFKGRKVSFGLQGPWDITCRSFYTKNQKTYFHLVINGENFSGHSPLVGAHNIQNIMAALCVVYILELDINKAVNSLSFFPGVNRRLTKTVSHKNLIVVDDYAHNPQKISCALASIKEAWPHHKLIVFFEPHRYSRIQALYQSFIESLRGASQVFVLPIYSAGETPLKGISSEQLAEDIQNHVKVEAKALLTIDEAMAICPQNPVSPTVIVTLGAGKVYLLAERLKEHFG